MFNPRPLLAVITAAVLCLAPPALANELQDAIEDDYKAHLGALFEHFHRNPELSLAEHKTAERMARELAEVGFEVTTGIGGTGLVAMLENGPGPLVMMRADMDGLPVLEKSGLEYASRATQTSPITGKEVPVMHACGHDVHITSLVGTARRMMAMRDSWSGTLMLLVQPAEERGLGARQMMDDGIWQRFGQPDYALAFHVSAQLPSGRINVIDGSPYAGVDSVDIHIQGVGAHGASPHAGKDPIVLGAQIVLALQTLVARELPPRDAGVVTVGSFHSGSKHNIIPDSAHLQLTVRNTKPQTRRLLLDGIKRIAENMGRAAGLPKDKLPRVVVADESTPPTTNDSALAQRLAALWREELGEDRVMSEMPQGMGAEDFVFLTADPYIPSVYFAVGGTPLRTLVRASRGGPPVPSHHSPLFKITPRPAITTGVEATVVALLDLLDK